MNKFVILILVCFLISACGVTPPRDYALQSKQVEKTVKMVPEWYTDLPVDDDMIYSSGAATVSYTHLTLPTKA